VKRWVALLVGVSCIVVARRGAGQGGGRVTGRVTLLEKGGGPSRDLGAAVVYLEAQTPVARPGSNERNGSSCSERSCMVAMPRVPFGCGVMVPSMVTPSITCPAPWIPPPGRGVTTSRPPPIGRP